MIVIDGSRGEGGGQVLRTALGLSLATGRAFRIEQIRAGREKPGLLRQHLTAVQAAATVGDARVEGDALGSTSVAFSPRSVEAGEYRFAVGSAGSATLVLQTVLPALLVAQGPSTLTLEGGTHNPWAPPFDFLQRVFLPIVNRLGPRVQATLVRHGFYPAGGGAFTVTIAPAQGLARLALTDRGEIIGRRVRALVANLPHRIGDREVATAARLLNWNEDSRHVEMIPGGHGPGNVVLVEIESDHITEMSAAFGEPGTPAEAVADKAAMEARRYLAAGVPVGLHLADQLLPILAVGDGGTFRTLSLTRHALTNLDVIRQFVNLRSEIVEEGRDVTRVAVARA